MFSKILVANRGEIAVRIIRACKEMGVSTVAVCSEADKDALHAALADQAYCIGGPEASDSYLNENQIISTALLAGAQATSEALSAFGDGSVYLEKYIYPARHVELQILADEYGNVVCLGERDCSLQRRNQKLIEETPSPAVHDFQRKQIISKAVEAVKKIGYVGAGTLEFLLERNGDFWFMEMNVRLQVEHCVTEMLTGIDLVKWQIRIAAGIFLNNISMMGSAMECRINAKCCGTLKMLHVPGGTSVRFDTCLIEGAQVTPYYDSLLGKLIVYAKTREETLRKLRAALCELVIEGIPTNIEEQLSIIADDRFVSGDYDLTFMGSR